MAAYALLIGFKGGEQSCIAIDTPPVIRKRFRESDGEGFERLEVVDTYEGRTRGRNFVSKASEPEKVKEAPKRRGRPPKKKAQEE